MSRSETHAVMLAMVIGIFLSTPASGQSYPARPIHLIIGQPSGGHSDLLGRIIAQRFAEILKQPVVVENRGGAGGTIAAETAARAPADGYTLLFAGSNNLAQAFVLIKDLRYGPQDFVPVGTIARVSYGLAVRSGLPVSTLADLVAYARAHPGELNYSSTGVASTSSLAFELLKHAAGIDIVHIPFKGSAIAVNELVAGRIDMVFTDLASLAPLADRGLLRLIGVAGAARSVAVPDVPTVAEQGYPELAIEPWYGIVSPAGTPPAIVAKLNDALIGTLRTPEVRSHLDRLGFVPFEMSPAQLGDVIRAEMKHFEAQIELTGIRPQR